MGAKPAAGGGAVVADRARPSSTTAQRAWAAVARRSELWPVAAITLLAAALRFPTLDLQSYWFDESVTVVDVLQPGLWDTLGAVASQDVTPPLYFVLAWAWTQLFGEGEVGLRSLSALFGTATVPVAYAIGFRLASRRTGLILAALFAASPLMLWFGQEARAYAVLIFVGALSMLAFLRALDERSARAIALWAGACALTLATHYFGGFIVAVECAWLLVATRADRRVVLAVGGLVAVVGALLPLLLHQTSLGGTAWLSDRALIHRFNQLPERFLTGPTEILSTPVIALAIVGLLIVVVAGARLLDRRERRSATLAAVLGAGTIAIPLALALIGKDYFLYRYIMIAWVPLAAALAVLLGSRAAGRPGLVVAGALVVGFLAMSVATLVVPRLQRDD